jgi:hypothetical protein
MKFYPHFLLLYKILMYYFLIFIMFKYVYELLIYFVLVGNIAVEAPQRYVV